MADQFGLYDSRMHRRSTDAALPVPLVESYSKKNVRCLRAAIGNERLIGRALKVRILKIHVGSAVTRRRHVDQASSRSNERRNSVDQDKVAQVIRRELRFEAIGCVAERGGHHPGIGHDHVERFSFCQQPVGTGTHAFQVGKIELNQFEASAIGRGVVSHLLGCSCGLVQIPRRPYNLSAVRGQRAPRFHADSG